MFPANCMPIRDMEVSVMLKDACFPFLHAEGPQAPQSPKSHGCPKISSTWLGKLCFHRAFLPESGAQFTLRCAIRLALWVSQGGSWRATDALKRLSACQTSAISQLFPENMPPKPRVVCVLWIANMISSDRVVVCFQQRK